MVVWPTIGFKTGVGFTTTFNVADGVQKFAGMDGKVVIVYTPGMFHKMFCPVAPMGVLVNPVAGVNVQPVAGPLAK